MDDKLFIRSEDGKTLYEGPLGKNADNIKLLFVMKEPNGNLDRFWMKSVFHNQENNRYATRYFNVLNLYIEKILGNKIDKFSTDKSMLDNIAFINLYPICGKSTTSGGGYESLRKIALNNDTSNTELSNTLKERLQIIKDALQNGAVVVAHYQIVEIMEMHLGEMASTHTIKDNNFNIKSYSYKGVEKIYAVQHPQSRRISDKKIEELFENVKSI